MQEDEERLMIAKDKFDEVVDFIIEEVSKDYKDIDDVRVILLKNKPLVADWLLSIVEFEDDEYYLIKAQILEETADDMVKNIIVDDGLEELIKKGIIDIYIGENGEMLFGKKDV